MIVGLDLRVALHHRTGTARFAEQVLAALRRRGVDARGLGATWRRPRADAPREGVVRRRLPARLQRALAPLGWAAETLLGEVDVFHHTDVVFAPVRAACQVVTVHDLLYLERPEWFDRGFVARIAPGVRAHAARAAAVVVPTPRTREAVLRHGLASSGRVHVVDYGCDHVDAAPRAGDRARASALLARAGLGPPGAGPLVLVPGTREPRKNQDALLRALLALRERHAAARALLVGPRGWGCEDLERRLARPSLRGVVGALGEIGDEDLGALLRVADVVAYPSLDEGFGLPAAEAMRCGRAVLTSRDTPMADLGGDAVELVDPRSHESLVRGLARLLGDAQRRAALGAAAAARVAPSTWDRTAAQLERVYERALAAGAPGAPR